MLEVFRFILDHPLHAGPIVLAGLFALAIVIERARVLYGIYPIPNEEKFFEGIQDVIMKGKIADGIALCDQYPAKPVARVVKVALLRAHQPDKLIEDGVALVVEDASERIHRRTSFLAMVANVATLLGLLGTIAGLITSFQAVSADNAAQKTVLLAQGISTAMNATLLGLGVAVPSMVAFSFLMNRSNRLISSVESASVRVLDMLRQRYFESEARVVPQKQLG